MKVSVSVLSSLLCSAVLSCGGSAFVVNSSNNQASFFMASKTPSSSSILRMASYELTPEPEGGEEVTMVNTMPGSRMKNMGVDTELSADDADDTVYKFWMTATADGKTVKDMRTQISKDASKNANFPGFRKGQVPPYAQPQMTMFAVQEGITKTCEGALQAYGLESLKGSDGSVQVIEEVKDICKGYKVGDDIPFTGTFSATIKEVAAAAAPATSEEESVTTVTDAEIVAEE